MTSLLKIIGEARKNKTAIGHFNISDLAGLKAIFEAAYALNLPVIIGLSEGEREFLGPTQAVALVASLREKYNFPIFLNADHTHSLEKIKEAVESGYDAVIFDGSKLSWEENIRETKKAVDLVRSLNKQILVEGEIGYIGSSSEILRELPKGAAVSPEDLTTPAQAEEFVKKTGVDLLAPAVGNIHGMLVRQSSSDGGFESINPRLDIKRIAAIAKAVKTPLVLHGGSGTSDEDFVSAISSGVSIIHINTEIRVAWRRGLEEGLKKNPEEIAPYKILSPAVEAVKTIVRNRLKLFSSQR